MKIEKVNDHQIRCTLTKNDLADRQLRISELAYGTDKAKNLFRDMMQQASFEFGFEAEDIPLMIEAIPLSAECIVLVITKVEDPDELDTRFSKFAPSINDSDEDDGEDDDFDSVIHDMTETADEVLDLFKKIQNTASDDVDTSAGESFKQVSIANGAPVNVEFTKMYSFASLNDVIRACHVLGPIYQGDSALYKCDNTSYMLVISQTDHTPEEFNKICNIISEYGNPQKIVAGSEAYMDEHCEAIIKHGAVGSLSQI